MNAPKQNVILMAEDDADDRLLVQEALAECKLDGTIRFVADGEELMDYLLWRGKYLTPESAPRPTFILLDLNMPVKNGWDTFERLTAEHPLIPIIIVTARPNQLFTALSAGAGALLEKPMDIPTLLRTMETLLAETGEQRLARLVGKKTEFHYKPAMARRD